MPPPQQHIYIPETKLENQIIEALGKIYITQEHKQWILQALRECFVDEQKYMQEQLNSLNAKKQKLRARIDGLYLDKIDIVFRTLLKSVFAKFNRYVWLCV